MIVTWPVAGSTEKVQTDSSRKCSRWFTGRLSMWKRMPSRDISPLLPFGDTVSTCGSWPWRASSSVTRIGLRGCIFSGALSSFFNVLTSTPRVSRSA